VPVLEWLSVSCRDSAVRLAWRWAGSSPVEVRALRSSQWFCDSPDAHVTGDWGQELLYEGRAGDVVDRGASDNEDVFYTVFARKGPRSRWRRPLRVCVRKAGYEPPPLGLSLSGSTAGAKFYAPGRLIDGRYVEVSGDREAPPVVGGRREWGLVVVPLATLCLLMGFLAGVDHRLVTVVALALAAGWRLLDGAQPDLRRLLRYLKIVALVGAIFWLAPVLLFGFFAGALGATGMVSRSILILSLYPLIVLAAMVGVWLFMGRALDDAGKPTRLRPFAVLAALLVLAAVAAPLACVLAAVYALVGLRRAAVARRAGRAERTAETQAQCEARAESLREIYTPWQFDEDADRLAPEEAASEEIAGLAASGSPSVPVEAGATGANVRSEVGHRSSRRRDHLSLSALGVVVALIAAVALSPRGTPPGHDIYTSANWAGYSATGQRFRSVSATWTQPQVQTLWSKATMVDIWVGLDGWSGKDATCEQTGIRVFQSGSNQGTDYWAWYEMLPKPPVVIAMAHAAGESQDVEVSPGDLITATVTSLGDQRFRLTLVDDTQGGSFSTIQTNPAATCASAEVIVEAHVQQGPGLPGFDPVPFINCLVDGRPIGSFDWHRINVATSDGQLMTSISALGADDTSFTVTRQ